jgi:hypothetical protein
MHSHLFSHIYRVGTSFLAEHVIGHPAWIQATKKDPGEATEEQAVSASKVVGQMDLPLSL